MIDSNLIPSASDTIILETDFSMLVSKDAARPIGDGKIGKMPMLVEPWRPMDFFSDLR